MPSVWMDGCVEWVDFYDEASMNRIKIKLNGKEILYRVEKGMVEEKSVWKKRGNICKISQDLSSPQIPFNYSIIKELFLLRSNV